MCWSSPSLKSRCRSVKWTLICLLQVEDGADFEPYLALGPTEKFRGGGPVEKGRTLPSILVCCTHWTRG